MENNNNYFEEWLYISEMSIKHRHAVMCARFILRHIHLNVFLPEQKK